MDSEKFEVFVPICDKFSITRKTVERLLSYGAYSVIALDNASTDAISDYLTALHNAGKLTRLRCEQRLGCAAARNLILSHTSTPIIIGIDDDVWVESENWFCEMLRVLKEYPDAGLVGPCGTRIATLRRQDCDQFGYENADYFGDETPTGIPGTELDLIPGMCMAMRRKAILEVGGYDIAYDPMVAQDAELCMCLKEAGWTIRLARAQVTHVHKGQNSHWVGEEISGIPMQELSSQHMNLFWSRWEKKTHLMENCKQPNVSLRKILVRAYWGIGDVLLQTPAIALLRAAYPEAELTHCTMEVPLRGINSIMHGNSDVDLIDPRHVPEPDLIVNFGGYQHYSMEEIADYHKRLPHPHIFCDMLKRSLAAKGIEFNYPSPTAGLEELPLKFYLTSWDHVTLPPSGRPRIAICRTTKGCPQKTWPAEKWQELAKVLMKKGYELIVIGIDGDFHFDCASLDLVGKLTFRQSASVVASSDVFIGHGDGLMMAAYALNVPLVCIWGAFADPTHFLNPDRTNVKILGRVLDCSYRFTYEHMDWLKQTCINDQTCICIRSIEVDEVVAAVDELLQTKEGDWHGAHTDNSRLSTT